MTADLLAVGDEARRRRERLRSDGRRRAAACSIVVGLAWLVGVTAAGQWARVTDNTAAAATMVVGSFVAGSTPQGGGAVAFPVFTKVLGVAAADARTFSLAIQAVGMGTASAAIVLTGRAFDRGALRVTLPAAIAGYLLGASAFSVVTPPGAPVKIVFTLVIAAAGFCTWVCRRAPLVEHLPCAPIDGHRRAIAIAAAVGGVASSLFGSGADVAVYLALTVVLGVRPSVGVATSVMTMAAVSVIGLARSFAVGDLVIDPAAAQVDLFGLWLAAVPVVVIGAPLGSWFAARVSAPTLARMIAALAVAEVVSTALFLDELRTDPAVAAFAVAGLITTGLVVALLLSTRDELASIRPPVPSVRRLDLELTTPP